MTSSTEVGFIFQFPAMKGTRAISSEREAERSERGAAPLAARSGAALPPVWGSAAGGTVKAAADAAPVTATKKTLRNSAMGIFFLSIVRSAEPLYVYPKTCLIDGASALGELPEDLGSFSQETCPKFTRAEQKKPSEKISSEMAENLAPVKRIHLLPPPHRPRTFATAKNW